MYSAWKWNSSKLYDSHMIRLSTTYPNDSSAETSSLASSVDYSQIDSSNYTSNVSSTTASILLPDELRTTASLVCGIILAVGVTGNVLVPLVVCRTKELRNSTNLFLINLSVADLLVLMVCMPTVLIELHSRPEVWLLGEEMCKLVPFVEMVVANGSVLTMLAISFERYYAICKPLKAGYKCTRMRAFVIILVVWLVAIVATVPVLSISDQTQASHIDGSIVPVCLTRANTTWQRVYFLIAMSAFFWGPLCILLVVYSVITKQLILDDTTKDADLVRHSDLVHLRARRQVVLMLAAVVAVFFLCLLPFRLFTLWLIIASTDQINSLGMKPYYNILYACRIMLYLNSAVNPILYNLISSKFRDAFVNVLCCRRRNRLLVRNGTFNTTNSSVVMSSLKNSLSRAAQQQQSSTLPNLTQKSQAKCNETQFSEETPADQESVLSKLQPLSSTESYV